MGHFRSVRRTFRIGLVVISAVALAAGLSAAETKHEEEGERHAQAKATSPRPDATHSDHLRQLQESIWKEQGYTPKDSVRDMFRQQILAGTFGERELEAERDYFRTTRQLSQLQEQYKRNPTPELGQRMEQLANRSNDLMGKFFDSGLHGVVMQSVREITGDVDLAMKPQEAIRHLRDSVVENPRDPALHQLLGEALSKEGRYGDAIKELSRAIALDPADLRSLEARAIANQRFGDYAAARRDALAVLAVDPNNAAALAVLKLSGGRDTPSKGPDAVDVKVPTGEMAGVGPASDSAVEASGALSSNRIVNLDPMRAQSVRLARDAAQDLDMKDWRKAADDAARALQADPNNAQAYYYQSVAYVQLNQYDLAVHAADEGLQVSPDDRVLLDAKATALNRAGRHAEARLASSKVLDRTERKDAQAWFNLAYADAGLGANRASIVDALGEAARLDAAFGPAYEAARLTPQERDLRYLFAAGAPSAAAIAAAERAERRLGGSPDRRYWLIVFATVVGGLLVALGFLHVFAPELSRRIYGPSSTPLKIATALVAGGEKSFEDVVVPGTYQVLRKIGSGGMGTVYEALDLSLRRRVAIKVMRSEIRDDPRERRRFIDEARSVAALRHPGIVQIFSIEEKPDLFLVFEYVEGKTLDRLLAEKGRLSFAEARRILGAVCEALQYAHSSSVIHRDLKPSNIMVQEGGAVKVMDFGVARQVKDAVSRMMTNTVCGTPSYMAPEIEQGVVSREADVFSLGVCLYELLTGDLPFGGTNAGLLLNKMNMNYRPLASRLKGLPRGIDEVLGKALQPEPAKRYASPGEFKAALDALAA